MKIIRTTKALNKYIASVKAQRKSIGFVPTMGALHEGHFSLVEQSVKKCDVTVSSIFVNPLQFGPHEDLDAYPRTFKTDSKGLRTRGVDVLFFPDYTQFYTETHQTYVTNADVQNLYCGAYRPGHFDGVLTVVAKFFNCIQPDVAFFGKKDYQQAYLIKQMVTDLSYPIKIVTGKTVRDASGLAKSSRNAYLTDSQRNAAIAISCGLSKAKLLQKSTPTTVARLRATVRKEIEKSRCDSIQYIEIASRKTLLPLKGVVKEKAVILIAAYYGNTRLIDNVEI